MFPTIETLSEETPPEARPVYLIVKHNYEDQGVIGVMLRKRAGQLKNMVAWRLYRTTPRDGKTPFGRTNKAFSQYYITGGYVFDYADAQKAMDSAVQHSAIR